MQILFSFYDLKQLMTKLSDSVWNCVGLTWWTDCYFRKERRCVHPYKGAVEMILILDHWFPSSSDYVVKGRGAWHAAVHGLTKSQTGLSNWRTTTDYMGPSFKCQKNFQDPFIMLVKLWITSWVTPSGTCASFNHREPQAHFWQWPRKPKSL